MNLKKRPTAVLITRDSVSKFLGVGFCVGFCCEKKASVENIIIAFRFRFRFRLKRAAFEFISKAFDLDLIQPF